VITIYQYSTSPFAEKIRRALAYKGVEFEIHAVPRDKVDDYAAISPAGKFPVIEDRDAGVSVYDSTDIIEYLDATFPGRPLIPADPATAALAHVLEDWADESLYFYEMTMRLAWGHNFEKKAVHEFLMTMPGLTVEQAVPMVTQAAQTKVAQQGIGKKPRDRVVRDAERHFAALDGLLSSGDWLAGDRLSVADLAVVVQAKALLYAEEVVPMVRERPRVQAWLDRVDEAAPNSQAQTAQPA
jgi:glutathione S-transferase